jgi:hypothetical protein
MFELIKFKFRFFIFSLTLGCLGFDLGSNLTWKLGLNFELYLGCLGLNFEFKHKLRFELISI